VTFPANGGPGSPSKRKSKQRPKPVKIRWDSSKTVARNASEKLPDLAGDFFAAGAALAAAGQPALAALHRFRLLTKRFRYVLELFRPCYGPGLDTRIEMLQGLQQRLGEISDCGATEDLLRKRTDLLRADRSRLVRHLNELATARVFKFQRHWQAEFAPGAVDRWTNYLARFAVARQRR